MSPMYYGEKVSAGELYVALANFKNAAERLDKIKKTLFYGRACGVPLPDGFSITCKKLPWYSMPHDEKAGVDVIHAIIGLATEAGEMVEPLMSVIHGHSAIDQVNLVEESGDSLWYIAALFRRLGTTFEKVASINIAKLRERFPNKFTEFDANNRNLEKERETLENGCAAG